MHIQRRSVANSYSISGPDVLTMPIPNISHGMPPLLECPLECSLKHIRMCVCTCVCTSLSVHVSPYIIIRNDGSRNIPHPTGTNSDDGPRTISPHVHLPQTIRHTLFSCIALLAVVHKAGPQYCGHVREAAIVMHSRPS